jgi:uncharacterized protein (DUF486 family)
MTAAWYGHLKYKHAPLLLVILLSWLIALPEYSLQVPANRLGHGRFTAPQLKIIQEAISIIVFILFSIFYLRETPNWRAGAAFILIFIAVMLAVFPGKKEEEPQQASVSTQRPEPPQGGQSSLDVSR